MGKIMVGHDIINDFRAIEYTCPECDIRDTAYMKILKQFTERNARSIMHLHHRVESVKINIYSVTHHKP